MSDKKLTAAYRFESNLNSMLNNLKDKIENPIFQSLLEIGVDLLKDRKTPLIDDFIATSSPEIWKKLLNKDENYLIEFSVLMMKKYNIPIEPSIVQNIFLKDKEFFWKYIHSFIRISIHHLNEKGFKDLAESLAKDWNVKL